MSGFCHREESGFTLIEILVAVGILMIGLVAVMQWYPMGTAGVESGRRQSVAVFLAEQKIEQIKAWSLSTTAGQGFATVTAGGTCSTAANGPCRNDGLNTIPGYPEYSRTVCITPAPTTTLVRVLANYRRVTDVGVFTPPANPSCLIPPPPGQQVQVELATLIAQH